MYFLKYRLNLSNRQDAYTYAVWISLFIISPSSEHKLIRINRNMSLWQESFLFRKYPCKPDSSLHKDFFLSHFERDLKSSLYCSTESSRRT